MRMIKNKFILLVFFITLISTNIFSSGTNIASASPTSEDGYEENDDFWNAYSIGTGYYSNLCQGDEDWFNISIGVNEAIQVSLYFDGSQNDIDFELYDSSYTHLVGSYGVGDYETVAWISDVSQYICIRIYGWDNNEAYDMDISIIINPDDWAEPNDYHYEATHLDFGSHSGMSQFDDDWYELWLEPHDNLEIKLFYDSDYTWMNLELYDQYENFLISGSWDWDYLSIDWTNDDYGKSFYIKIIGNNIGDWYDIELNLKEDDWAEENDIYYEAKPINLVYHNQLVQYDDDWYSVWIESNDVLEIKLFYDTENTWMNLELYDQYENFLISGYFISGDHLFLNWTNNDYSRDFYIRVIGDNEGESYDLDLKIAVDGDGKNGDGTDPFANIPGFPIEIVGIVFIISSLAVILYLKKKRH